MSARSNGDYGPDSDAATGRRASGTSAARAPILHYFVMNTRRPLFAGTRMRRAVELRARPPRARPRVFAADPGQRPVARPTSSSRPGCPDFRDAAIYPLGGPDLERARRLAGDRRRRGGALHVQPTAPASSRPRIARRNLAAIGIDVDVKLFPCDELFRRVAAAG